MTIYNCTTCGKPHDSETDPPCPVKPVSLSDSDQYFACQVVEENPGAATLRGISDAKAVGAQIRALLLSLHAPSHSADNERMGIQSYETDRVRREALDHAGICCCDWSLEKPEGPRLELVARLPERST